MSDQKADFITAQPLLGHQQWLYSAAISRPISRVTLTTTITTLVESLAVRSSSAPIVLTLWR